MQADHPFWRSLVLAQLKVLLDSSPSYNPSRIQSCLDLMDKHVVGALGLRPTSSLAPWKSYLTDDHSPIEYSLSVKKGACVVRLAFEPISVETGTPADPVNSIAPSQWLSGFKLNVEDLAWFTKLSSLLTINAQNNSPLRPSACGLTQHVFALDFKEKPMLKSYIFHDALARQSSSTPAEWGKQKHTALTKALAAIGLEKPWTKVISYLDSLSSTCPEYAGQAEFISWDVVEPEKARVKVYVRFSKADLSRLLSHLALGGALELEKSKQHTQEIQMAATELWDIFAREDGADTLITDNIDELESRTRGVILYYELRLGYDEPLAKFYLPVRHYFSSDLPLAERFDTFLARKQISTPGWYLSLLNSFSNHRSLGSRSGLQTMLGCAVRGGEWELSMYISAEAYAPERWQDPQRPGLGTSAVSYNQM